MNELAPLHRNIGFERKRRRLLALVAVGLIAGLPRASLAADPALGVLILHSNQRATPAQVIVDDTLRSVVGADFKQPVQLYSEYLDDELIRRVNFGTKQADFLRSKYEARNIRVIVAVAIPALDFATRYRDQIAAGAPIVHTLVARDRVEPATFPSNVVGNFEDNDPLPTLQLALRLHPDARRVVLIRGDSERDRLWDKRLLAAVEKLPSAIRVEHLAGLPTAAVLNSVAALPRETIVFTPGYFVDGAGEVTTPRKSVEGIAAASAVPVYGAFDTFIGTGIVGGYMTPYDAQAREAGAIVVRLLNGSAAVDLTPASVTRVPMVDWRQLRRWRIDERLLPSGTVVAHREPAAWDRYRVEIAVGIAVLLLQAALISALLLQRRSSRRTAVALEASQRQMTLAASAARLSLWSWDTREHDAGIARPPTPMEAPDAPSTAFRQVLDKTHPADRERLQQTVDRALATGDEFDVEYRVIDMGGGVRWIDAHGRAERGHPGRLIGVALDVTERKASELNAEQDRAALRHLSRVSMVGQLSAAIAHQLNQPLAAILGNAEAAQKMLGRDNVDLKELRAIFGDIVAEDVRASQVIRRLRELYHRGDMTVGPVDLNELVRETLDLLRTELQLRHVTVSTDLDPALPLLDGGRVQLQQVLMNLILNATDAMSNVDGRDRKLTLRTESLGGEVSLRVIDSGSGISEEYLHRVFDPFWSSKPGGMGMGLAICQSIVAAHRGSMTVSNNADHGAAFRVTLPTRHRGSP